MMEQVTHTRRQPSLQGRLLRVLLAALGLVAAVIIAMDYLAFRSAVSQRASLVAVAEGLGQTLAYVDESVAAPIVKAADLQFNRARQATGLAGIEDLLFQLQTPQGRVVYASTALQGAPAFSPQQARADVIQVQGRGYSPWLHESPRWRTVLLEPVVPDGQLLRWLGGEVLQAVLVAVPLLLIPLWWAVRTGLLPLRQLASAITRRDAADLSPLQLDLRYAELQPIVGAMDGLLDRARRQVAHERELMHNTAHELRTPLAVVAAQAHALSTAPDPAAAEGARLGVQRGVQRASHLVEQLLALARLESPAASPAAEAIDLVAACRQHLIDLTPLADARGIDLALVSPDDCRVAVVVPAIHSILDNLLRNALQHCPPGSQVELHLTRQDGRIRIEVVDDGPGMPAEERELAFERFFRGRDAGQGSGLGLSIVKEAARLLRGRAYLSAGHAGKGLRATVELSPGGRPPPTSREAL